MNPYIMTPSSISVLIGGKSYIINSGHPNYEAIREAVKVSNWDIIPILADVPKTIEKASKGAFKVTDNEVTYNGELIHNVVATRILQFLREGEDFKPLLAFLERLYNNPSRRSIEELYKFLEHKNLPLDVNGYFYAYKAVRNDYTDKHSGKFDNHIGNIVKVNRREVDDDARRGCSYGLHVGSLEYVKSFANGYGLKNGDHIVIVKVDPAHVVSVPYDCKCQKVRVEQYEVIEEFVGELPETVYGENERLYDNNDDDDLIYHDSCPNCGDDLNSDDWCENCETYNDEWYGCDNCGDIGRLETFYVEETNMQLCEDCYNHYDD